MGKDNKYMEIRYNQVVKANELIQKSRFNLSLLQQKIVLYLISRISPYDEDFKVYEFDIIEFCRVCGIDTTSGKNYADLKQAVKEIADKSLWIKIDEDEETLLRWIEKPYINKKSGLIRIRLDEDMKPYLLQLKKNFTRYELIWTLHFKSKYTIRLYELLKSYHYDEREEYRKEFSVDDLRTMLDADTYKDYKNFKSRVLVKAIQEINDYSDKIVSFEEVKVRRRVENIIFTIGTKDIMERTRLESEIEKEMGIDPNQMTLWDKIIESDNRHRRQMN